MGFYSGVMKPSVQRFSKKPIFGFDIETYDNNKKFYCGTLYNLGGKFKGDKKVNGGGVWNDDTKTWSEKDSKYRICFDKKKMRNVLINWDCRGGLIAATNLGFDFFGTFEDSSNFTTLFRGSELIFAKTSINESHESTNIKDAEYRNIITFIDTLNYARLGVRKLGDILKLPKLEKPRALGRLPNNISECDELVTYNKRDAEISAKGLKFLYDKFEQLGASTKYTIASTAMSLFRNKYLKKDYFRQSIPDLLQQFKGYYGGRTEALCRGVIKDCNYYDFNSLYPSVMMESLPDPNLIRYSCENTTRYIENFDGVADVDVSVPQMKYPPLPYRTEDKLLFPCGTFGGWHSNEELRYAIRQGVTITKVRKTYYAKDNCEPFIDYIRDLYALRKELMVKEDPAEFVVKILMNGLYGKFGQKFLDRDNYIHQSIPYEQLLQYDYVEPIGDWFRVKKSMSEPPSYTIPLWALNITAKARMKLHEYMVMSDPVYVDTDSLMTQKDFETSNALGKLKLEMRIDEGMVVKPKFYSIKGSHGDFCKVKGVGHKLVMGEFNDLLKNGRITYQKFTRFKEALRRDMIPNEIVDITKHLSLEDNKRVWPGVFSKDFQESKALWMQNGIVQRDMPKLVISHQLSQ